MPKSAKKKKHEHDLPEPIIEPHVDDEVRTVYLVGDITEDLIRSIVEKIVSLSEKNAREPITMIINTHGGSVDDTFMLYDLMKYIPTPIHTVGLGKIMSAGCLLLAAGAKGHRKIGRNARIMYHCGWDEHHGSIWKLRSWLQAFQEQETQYDLRFAEETGLTLQQVEALYDKDGPTTDHFLSADRAVELGIVDVLI
jgi:ATP-dependent Clp protease, protease subunit